MQSEEGNKEDGNPKRRKLDSQQLYGEDPLEILCSNCRNYIRHLAQTNSLEYLDDLLYCKQCKDFCIHRGYYNICFLCATMNQSCVLCCQRFDVPRKPCAFSPTLRKVIQIFPVSHKRFLICAAYNFWTDYVNKENNNISSFKATFLEQTYTFLAEIEQFNEWNDSTKPNSLNSSLPKYIDISNCIGNTDTANNEYEIRNIIASTSIEDSMTHDSKNFLLKDENFSVKNSNIPKLPFRLREDLFPTTDESSVETEVNKSSDVNSVNQNEINLPKFTINKNINSVCIVPVDFLQFHAENLSKDTKAPEHITLSSKKEDTPKLTSRKKLNIPIKTKSQKKKNAENGESSQQISTDVEINKKNSVNKSNSVNNPKIRHVRFNNNIHIIPFKQLNSKLLKKSIRRAGGKNKVKSVTNDDISASNGTVTTLEKEDGANVIVKKELDSLNDNASNLVNKELDGNKNALGIFKQYAFKEYKSEQNATDSELYIMQGDHVVYHSNTSNTEDQTEQTQRTNIINFIEEAPVKVVDKQELDSSNNDLPIQPNESENKAIKIKTMSSETPHIYTIEELNLRLIKNYLMSLSNQKIPTKDNEADKPHNSNLSNLELNNNDLPKDNALNLSNLKSYTFCNNSNKINIISLGQTSLNDNGINASIRREVVNDDVNSVKKNDEIPSNNGTILEAHEVTVKQELESSNDDLPIETSKETDEPKVSLEVSGANTTSEFNSHFRLINNYMISLANKISPGNIFPNTSYTLMTMGKIDIIPVGQHPPNQYLLNTNIHNTAVDNNITSLKTDGDICANNGSTISLEKEDVPEITVKQELDSPGKDLSVEINEESDDIFKQYAFIECKTEKNAEDSELYIMQGDNVIDHSKTSNTEDQTEQTQRANIVNFIEEASANPNLLFISENEAVDLNNVNVYIDDSNIK